MDGRYCSTRRWWSRRRCQGSRRLPTSSPSAITVVELEYGVGAAADPVERQRRRRREQLVVDTFDVIPFDIAVAQSYGLLANLVRAAGRDPRPWRLDLLIAATAERHGLSLATCNAADFRYLERVLDVVEVP